MIAEIINLADARAARSRSQDAAALDAHTERLRTFQLLAKIACNLGLPPDHRGERTVTRRPPPPPAQETPLDILNRIAVKLGLPEMHEEEPPRSRN